MIISVKTFQGPEGPQKMEGGGTSSYSQVSYRGQIVGEGVMDSCSLDADPDPPEDHGRLEGIGFILGRELDRGFAEGLGSSG